MGSGGSLVVAPGTAGERVVPIVHRLLVGRECAGVEPSRCLIMDAPAVSREHLEVRVDPGRGAQLVDLSTNGTWVNGRRVERNEPIALVDGDVIELGGIELAFRAPAVPAAAVCEMSETIRTAGATQVAVAVGDVVGYTSLTEAHGGGPVGEALDPLFARLRELLARYRGTVSNIVGDAIFAAWDADRDPGAAASAVAFALAAVELVSEYAATLSLLDADGAPLRMGWGVTLGAATAARPSPARETVHGDAVNLAFRLSGLAAREGRPFVLVAAEAAAAAPRAARYGAAEEIQVRGRRAPAIVHAAGASASRAS
jgi:adenylate cyclase